MDLRLLVDEMVNDGSFVSILGNPMAQFGTPARSYLGATLLPERLVAQNVFKEEQIHYRSVIANAATRYSPPQKKGNALIGSVIVELAENDIASEFSAQDFDALIRIVERIPGTDLSVVPPEAMAQLLSFVDLTINVPLIELNEVYRWQAIVGAVVQLRGDNNFYEDVPYVAPSGHRVAAGGQWSNNNYDPYYDIIAGWQKLISKGYQVARMICSTAVLTKLLGNQKIAARLGFISIASGAVVGVPGVVTRDALNARLASDGLPPIETYDLQYRKTVGTDWFLARDVFVMVATTGRDQSIDMGDSAPTPNGQPLVIENTLGYVGVGRPANRTAPGRAVVVKYDDGKAMPVTAQGWQTSLPVVAQPEAIYVITGIS